MVLSGRWDNGEIYEFNKICSYYIKIIKNNKQGNILNILNGVSEIFHRDGVMYSVIIH